MFDVSSFSAAGHLHFKIRCGVIEYILCGIICTSLVGSGPRYQILSHVFARCAIQKNLRPVGVAITIRLKQI